jgi:hypothetical protein
VRQGARRKAQLRNVDGMSIVARINTVQIAKHAHARPGGVTTLREINAASHEGVE